MEGWSIDRVVALWAEGRKDRYGYLEAEGALREFRRSRRRALVRRLHSSGAPAPGAVGAETGGNRVEVAIDSIVGVEARGGGNRAPIMGRSLAAVWLKEYLNFRDSEEEWTFDLSPRGRGWLLRGGGVALVRLEILRSRGYDRVSGRIASPAGMLESGRQEGGGGLPSSCREGGLGAA